MGPIVRQLLKLPPEQRKIFLDETLTPEQYLALLYDWTEWGRIEQQLPDDLVNGRTDPWVIWMILAGRGWGKTRTGSEACNTWVAEAKACGQPIRIALVAETKRDAREVIALGESGILATAPPWDKPKYEPSKGLITWPSGSLGFLYSGEEPDQLRGPQFHKAWVDEWAKYQYPVETMDNLEMALRLGELPQMIITTTPRPLPMLKEKLVDSDVHLTRGHTNENRANLARSYIRRVVKKYEGTRIGRQELAAEILDDVEGGLWTREMIEQDRLSKNHKLPEMVRIAIAIDPATTNNEKSSNETGMIAGGKGTDGKLYIFHDLSGRFSPRTWARRAITHYDKWEADALVAERNNGGDLVASNIEAEDDDGHVVVKTVWASRGKHVRAEPVATKHEQHQIKFVGHFPELEDQLIFYTPEGYEGVGSPDRGDAFVWLAWFLLLGAKTGEYDPDDFADSKR